MSVFRIHKNKDYTIMSNIHLKDNRLSFKEKGILSVMLSLPDSWDYSIKGLAKLGIDKESATRTALISLEKYGYLVRKAVHSNGKIVDWEYNIYEYPQNCQCLSEDLLLGGNQHVENLHVENLHVENQTQYNTNILNTNKLNTNDNTLPISKDICNDIISEPQAVAEPKQTHSSVSYRNSSTKKSLLNNSTTDDIKKKEKEIISRPRVRVYESSELKPTKQIKRESYLRKAIQLATETLKLSEPEKIKLIKDWLDTLYDKGITSTTHPRFKYAIEELNDAIEKYSWETLNTIIKDAITSNHSTLRYVIQNRSSSRYNKQTLSDKIKFPGMRDNESVDEYIGRTKEIEAERQKALAEIEEAKKNGTGNWY